MNTPKIARLYPVYLDMLRRQLAEPTHCLVALTENQLRAEVLLRSGRRYSIALRDYDQPARTFDFVGSPTDDFNFDFVPARVFSWAQQQLPAALGEPACWLQPQVGWVARLQAGARSERGIPGQPAPAAAPSVYVERQGEPTELAGLARGLRAHQAKRRRHARRLLAQLWVYHCQQPRQAVAAEREQQKGGQAQ